jgi:hypothetical protein
VGKSSATGLSQRDVAVIGARPYGLSLAPISKRQGLPASFRESMEFWAKKMPDGLLLRSSRVASNLSDPDDAFALAFEAASKIAPSAPVPLDILVHYGP